MRRSFFTFSIVLLFASLSTSFAHEDATGIVKERMDKYLQSQRDLKSSFKSAKSGDFKDVIEKTKTMIEWGQIMPSYFPVGSGGAPSEASPQIWEDMTGFTEASLRFVEAAQEANDAAEAQDADATISALKALGKTCGSCHRNYRIK